MERMTAGADTQTPHAFHSSTVAVLLGDCCGPAIVSCQFPISVKRQ